MTFAHIKLILKEIMLYVGTSDQNQFIPMREYFVYHSKEH